ncbi:MAG: 2-oxoglutarate dehydrogenase complex dihydrolipoyllysine-residue succinyltransferase [SAR202 cluster bacterium]|nr:2-oxoglutarate dehydrogenase complex dihydrolipoyllysine-residue succinyltransferase [SAR202 cluster bacterium]
MSVEIKVPEMGESIVEATVGKWLKRQGDKVAAGEAVVELETDKVNVEVAAPAEGTVEVLLKTGENVKVGSVLGKIVAGAGAAAPASNGQPAAKEAAPAKEAAEDGVKATPVARNLAEKLGVDLKTVKGTDPGGKISREDVEAAAKAKAAPAAPAKAPEAPARPQAPGAAPAAAKPAPVVTRSQSGRVEERIKLSRRRQTTAKKLVEAHHIAAMTTTFNEVDMGAIMELRKARREEFKKRNNNTDLGFMPFFVKAVVGGLKAHPWMNSELAEDELVLKKYYDIGIAVGSEDGLVVPVLRDADKRTFAQIEAGIAELVAKTKERKLTIEDLTGATFTITNGGVFGSLMSTPTLTPPQVGILGMHGIKERPAAVNGQVVIRPMMYLAVTYDHRVVDGSEAVRFLVRVKELLEDPARLLLET